MKTNIHAVTGYIIIQSRNGWCEFASNGFGVNFLYYKMVIVHFDHCFQWLFLWPKKNWKQVMNSHENESRKIFFLKSNKTFILVYQRYSGKQLGVAVLFAGAVFW